MSIPTHEQYVVRRAKARVRLILGYLENQNWRFDDTFLHFAVPLPQHLREREVRLEKMRNQAETSD
jgi:hypothetical protein